MKILLSKSLLASLILLTSVLATAETNLNGCLYKGIVVPFKNFHQRGAALVGTSKLSQNTIVEYQNVYNQSSLTLYIGNKAVASNTVLMAPVELKIEVEGQLIYCRLDEQSI